MGILSPTTTSSSLMSEATVSRQQLVTEAGRVFESTYADRESFRSLSEDFNSGDAKVEWRAALTIQAVEKTRTMLEDAKIRLGESVVQASLGQLNPRVLDVVRLVA